MGEGSTELLLNVESRTFRCVIRTKFNYSGNSGMFAKPTTSNHNIFPRQENCCFISRRARDMSPVTFRKLMNRSVLPLRSAGDAVLRNIRAWQGIEGHCPALSRVVVCTVARPVRDITKILI